MVCIRRPSRRARTRRNARTVARTVGSRGDPPHPGDDPDPLSSSWSGLAVASTRLRVHLQRRAAAMRAA
jgi:hypothetical protein